MGAKITEYPKLFLSLSIVSAVFLLYWNVLGHPFVWDDYYVIVDNKYIQNWQYFLNLFSENTYEGSGSTGVNWRPAMLLVFSGLWHSIGPWSPAYHFTSIVFHAIDAVLLFVLFNLIFKRRYLAFISALLFAIHPLQTQAVTYIAGFGDPLSTFFMLSGAIFYIKSIKDEENRRRLLLATGLMQILALCSKESAVMMPGLLFLADFFAKERGLTFWGDIKSSLKKILPFLGILAFYVLLRLTFLNFLGYLQVTSFATPLYERIFIFWSIFPEYLRLVFAPLHLHMEHTVYWVHSLFEPKTLLGLGIFSLFIFLIVKTWKHRPEVSFGLLWFFVAFSPNANIFMPSTNLFGEHWLYLSLPGLFIAIFALANELFEKRKYFIALIFLLSLWVGWISSIVISRNNEWKTSVSILTQTLEEEPKMVQVMIVLGNIYRDSGEHEKAFELYDRAIQTEPTNPIVYSDRAKLWKKLGNEKEMVKNMERSVLLGPAYSPAFNPLVKYYERQGNLPKLKWLYEMRLTWAKEPKEALGISLKLANIAVGQGNRALAQKYLEKAEEFDKKLKKDPAVFLEGQLSKLFP